MAELMLSHVSKAFGDKTVVDDVSMRVDSGELIALLGPSGCGKTTVLRLLAGFLAVDKGEIHIDNQCIASPDKNTSPEARNMGMVFQSYALWPHMNVFDNVAYPLKIRKIAEQQRHESVMQALQQTGLYEYADRNPQDLSGGQRQRVALARCLVTQPAVILLDEPLANLDKHLRATMEETFRRFNQTHCTTMIYVTHDQAEAMSLANRVAVMNQGKLLQFDTPERLYQQPQTPWLGNFIGSGSQLRLGNVKGNIRGSVEGGEMLHGSTAIHAAYRAANQQVHTALVRPQHVSICDEGLPARVTRSVFRGERYLTEARLNTDEIVRFYCDTRLPIDSEVQVSIERAWVYPDN